MADTTKWRVVIICILGLALKIEKVTSSQEIVKKMTIGFSKVLDECKTELNLPEHVMQDFFAFWREEYDLVHTELGCAIMCMAAKFDLITEDMKLHHGNAHGFAKSHGADDDVAKQLVGLIHDCEKIHMEIKDDCSKVLEIAKCFRTKIHGLKWAPSMETVLEEVMTEVQ